jgi:hypothetical protein
LRLGCNKRRFAAEGTGLRALNSGAVGGHFFEPVRFPRPMRGQYLTEIIQWPTHQKTVRRDIKFVQFLTQISTDFRRFIADDRRFF